MRSTSRTIRAGPRGGGNGAKLTSDRREFEHAIIGATFAAAVNERPPIIPDKDLGTGEANRSIGAGS